MRWPWNRARRYTSAEIEALLQRELPHWLPYGGEAGETPQQRNATAKAAAKIIVGRLS